MENKRRKSCSQIYPNHKNDTKTPKVEHTTFIFIPNINSSLSILLLLPITNINKFMFNSQLSSLPIQTLN